MAITVKKTLGSEWYTPASEKESEEPARFKLKDLNREQLDDAMNGAMMDDKGSFRLSPQGTRSALKNGIEEWEGVEDESGEKLKCTFVNHRYLPWQLGQELAAEIVTKAMLGDPEEKNS